MSFANQVVGEFFRQLPVARNTANETSGRGGAVVVWCRPRRTFPGESNQEPA